MINAELHDNPYWQTILLSARLRPDVSLIAERHGLTLSQMHALLYIEPSTLTPMSQLSQMIYCDASYLTGIVDKLVSLGYIERKESLSDRRIKTIELTESGTIFRKNLISDFNDFYKKQSPLKDIDADAAETLCSMIKLVDNQQSTNK